MLDRALTLVRHPPVATVALGVAWLWLMLDPLSLIGLLGFLAIVVVPKVAILRWAEGVEDWRRATQAARLVSALGVPCRQARE